MKKLCIRIFLLVCMLTAAIRVSAQWRIGFQAGYLHNARTTSTNDLQLLVMAHFSFGGLRLLGFVHA